MIQKRLRRGRRDQRHNPNPPPLSKGRRKEGLRKEVTSENDEVLGNIYFVPYIISLV